MDGTIKQVFATMIVGQVLVAMGVNCALHSITLIQVPQDEDRFMDDDQLNWTIAVTALALMVGSCLAMPIAPVLGARRLLVLTQPIYALASLSAGFGKHLGWVLLGRILTNISIGMSEGTARSYVSEIVPPNKRTLYTAILNTMVFASQAIFTILGRYAHWRIMFLIAGFFPAVVCLAGLYFIPNSPKWLLSHGHSEEEARRAIHFFHGKEADADAEIRSTKDSLRETHVDGVSIPMRKLILRRDTLQPLLLVTGQMVIFIWSGGNGINFILPLILKHVNLPLDQYQSAMLPMALSASLCVPTSVVIERFGRLPLLCGSGAISAAGCAAIVTFFFLPEAQQQTSGSLVLVGSVIVHLTFACVIAPIALTYVNELLPNRTRIFCANITMGMVYTDLFILLKTFPLLSGSIGLGGIFVINGVVSLVQVAFATFFLPETKDLSLEQIQQMFQSANKVSGESSDVDKGLGVKPDEESLALE
ncbi:facilitated trehalose transporter Tret1-like [Pollicipes pollicipes]|uniref:facilitated trehalose transporter Tret1-like n=1 Tax=Pollicipes pollicipes TaxID=41117 RepID=UPI001885132C|nr:facilitated trehalose transporter Tret1-like [Pollicipes pollicipes]